MSIVAISQTLGSLGDEIGRELARALSYEFADREIILQAAERFGEGAMSPDLVPVHPFYAYVGRATGWKGFLCVRGPPIWRSRSGDRNVCWGRTSLTGLEDSPLCNSIGRDDGSDPLQLE